MELHQDRPSFVTIHRKIVSRRTYVIQYLLQRNAVQRINVNLASQLRAVSDRTFSAICKIRCSCTRCVCILRTVCNHVRSRTVCSIARVYHQRICHKHPASRSSFHVNLVASSYGYKLIFWYSRMKIYIHARLIYYIYRKFESAKLRITRIIWKNI